MPTAPDGPGGISPGGLERLMRRRWLTISSLWENNKSVGSRLNLLQNLDYQRKLSSQLAWQSDNTDTPVRVIYTSSGQPTAAILDNDAAFVENVLFWVACEDMQEARYLLAIINSDALYEAVQPLMAKGQYGPRHLHKHLWKLPIPEFDGNNALHASLARAGERAASGVAERLAELRDERRDKLTVTIARRELRKWLSNSPEGAAVEEAVKDLLA